MAKDDKTVFDPGATKREGDATIYEGAATVADSAATVADSAAIQLDDSSMTAAALSDAAGRTDAPVPNLSIQKGDTILGTYKVESNAIKGGMGSVWRVHHTGWNTDLAMKRPQPQCFATEKSKADFIHECEAWINLGLHPNIVSCYYVREISGTPSIFSEWMDGGSLESAIHKGTLYAGTEAEQQERILDIAIQFARGLHYAHEAGLIHQDVKPDNLLLTREGDAKVADFGLAKARAILTVVESTPNLQEAADSGKTIASPSGGYTPAYCSMEQMDGKKLTRRTDIYSWAVSVMELYIGSRPWANGVVAGLSCGGYFEDTKLPMPEALQELLATCMEAEPDDRPHDFTEIEAKLQEIYKAETGNDYPRPAPKAAADTADSLNNRALSMLDLGKKQKAIRYWQEALGKNPHHIPAYLSMNLLLWRIKQKSALQLEDAMQKLERELPFNVELATMADGIRKEISSDESERYEETACYQISRIKSYADTVNFEMAIEKARNAMQSSDYRTACSKLRKAREISADESGKERMDLGKRLSAACERSDVYQPVYVPGWETEFAYARCVALDETAQKVFISCVGPDAARLNLPKEHRAWRQNNDTVDWMRAFEKDTGRVLLDVKSGEREVYLSSDATRVIYGVSGGYRVKSLEHWDEEKAPFFGVHSPDEKAKQTVISKDGKLAAMIGFDTYGPKRHDYVWLWELGLGKLNKGKLKKKIKYDYDTLQYISLSDDGSHVALGIRGGRVEILDRAKWKVISSFNGSPENSDQTTKVCISGDGTRAVLWFADELNLYTLNRDGAKLQRKVALGAYKVKKIWFTPKGDYVIAEAFIEKKSSLFYSQIHFIRFSDGARKMYHLPVKSSNPSPTVISGDGNYCLVGNRLWQIDWMYDFDGSPDKQAAPMKRSFFGKRK